MIIKNYVGIPVLIQLKNPVLGVFSSGEVELEDGTKCGVAALASYSPENQPNSRQPYVLQVLQGSIEEVDDDYLTVATLGTDQKTPVRCCIERENVANVSFCLEHHALPTTPTASKIIS